MLFRAARSSARSRGRSGRDVALAAVASIAGFTVAAVVTVACGVEDPGELDTGNGPFPEPNTGMVGTASPTATSTTGPGPGMDGGTVTGMDGSTKPPGDSGTTPADSGPVKIIQLPAIFAAAPPYDRNKLPLQTAASLAGNKHAFTDGTNPFGQDCSTCHFPGGSASNHVWLIGGSVTDDAGNGLGGVEVVMVAPDGGVVVTVYTDTDGNLWVPPIADSGSASIPAGAQMMVRKADGEDNFMSTKVAASAYLGCANSNCHGGVQGLPHAP